MVNKGNYDWPGWPLDQNPYGKEFDLDARIRMVQGSRKLLPLINKYESQVGSTMIEAGPFFEPLLTPDTFPGKSIIYVDNDHFVADYLAARFPDAHIISHDFKNPFLELQDKIKKVLKIAQRPLIGSLVASHLLNYIDFQNFILTSRELLFEGGLLFINNSIDYGLPSFFSSQRPRNNAEIIEALVRFGFDIVKEQEILSENREIQLNSRLLLVARKK